MNKKVLIIAPFDLTGRFVGGITYVAKGIVDEAGYLLEKGFEIEVFNTCIEERNRDSAGKFRLENLKNAYKINKGIVEELKTHNYDVLYYHTSKGIALIKDLLIIRQIKKISKIKVVLHIHFAEIEKILYKNKLINKVIINLFNKYIEYIVFLSKKTENEFIQNGLTVSKTTCIYNFQTINLGIDKIKIKANDIFDKDIIDIVFLGSIDKRKGIIDALKALKMIDNKKFIFHICGVLNDKEIEIEFKELVEVLKNNIVLHGYVKDDEKTNILFKSDIILIPSYGEGLPISLLEAMAAGCAVITTTVGAIPEIITNNKNGFFIEVGDVTGMTKKIDELIFNKQLCAKQMLNNYNDSKHFSIHSFLDELCKVL